MGLSGGVCEADGGGIQPAQTLKLRLCNNQGLAGFCLGCLGNGTQIYQFPLLYVLATTAPEDVTFTIWNP